MKITPERIAAVIIIIALCAWALIGCNRGKQSVIRPPQQQQAQADPPVQRWELSANSNFIAQLAEPIEVDALIHYPDYRTPTRVKMGLARGTWLTPEHLGSIEEAEERAHGSGSPFHLVGTK